MINAVRDHFARREQPAPKTAGALCLIYAALVLFVLCSLPGTRCFSMDRSGEDPGHGFLFRASRPDATVYLIGSIHALGDHFSFEGGHIEPVYQSCPTLVFEADMDEAARPETRILMAASGLLPEGEDLSKHLCGTTKDLLEHRLASSKFSLETFLRFRPWLVSVTLSMHELKRLGFDSVYGIDTTLYRRARQDGKDLIFLETALSQIRMLSEMPPVVQDDLLVQTLKELTVIEEKSAEMIAAWKRGDVQVMEEITMMSLRGHPEIFKRLFADRNRAWANKIEGISRSQSPVLVIVGAGHLVGDEGVLALLRVKGYSVEQMRGAHQNHHEIQ